jgi:LemA protein
MESLAIVIVTAIIIVVVGIILIFNNCITLKNKIKQSRSTIDVYLTQRFDLIPNLVECVKAYAEYEAKTLQTIAELRNTYNKTKSLNAASDLVGKMNVVMAQSEAVPDLKASQQFIILQKSLIKIESQLQAARRVYNGDVTLYNTAIQTFPNNMVAKILHFETEELFTIEEYKTQKIEVKI